MIMLYVVVSLNKKLENVIRRKSCSKFLITFSNARDYDVVTAAYFHIESLWFFGYAYCV